jgi:hypothetical protein
MESVGKFVEKAAKMKVTHDAFGSGVWSLWKVCRDLSRTEDFTQEDFQRLSVVTLTQIGSVAAIDCGLTEEQFLATCKANFNEAHKQAPRWG